MNSPKEMLAAGANHESWRPMLELATQEVFQLMLGCELKQASDGLNLPPGVTSMVGLAGRLCGVMTVHCDEKAAALITSKTLGVPLDKVGGEMSDALGEICNMVAGNFKNKISGLGDGCMLSPPTVVTGTDYSTPPASRPVCCLKACHSSFPCRFTLSSEFWAGLRGLQDLRTNFLAR